jgi:hypothetical protein
MNKFQKLAQLNRDIELLENAGKIKAADVLHKKFIKEAQFAMPMTYNPMMFNPMAYNPMAYNPMAARTVVNPGVTTAPMPVVQPKTTQVQTIGTPNPGVIPAPTPATTSTTTTPAPASGQVNPPGIKPGTPPTNLTRSTNQQGQAGYVQDGSGKIQVFGQDGQPINYVAPPGSTLGSGLSQINPTPAPGYVPPVTRITPPTQIQNQRFDGYAQKLTGTFNTVDDPKKLQEFRKNIQTQLNKELREKRLTQEQYDQLMDQLYGN